MVPAGWLVIIWSDYGVLRIHIREQDKPYTVSQNHYYDHFRTHFHPPASGTHCETESSTTHNETEMVGIDDNGIRHCGIL